jgi:alkaline phosphatase
MSLRHGAIAFLMSTALVAPSSAEAQSGAKNIILMISDGIGFNGWLAADYYQGRAGQQSYQVARPDGATPVVFGQTHWSINLVDERGRVLSDEVDASEAAGVFEQGYDPATRWTRFENTFLNDFPPVELDYTSYTDSSSAGTALHTGRKTLNGRLNIDWTGEIAFRTIAEIAMAQGRAAGTVTSVQASHATPASALAHNLSRNNYEEIFTEMVESDLTVVMGAGHPMYDSSGNAVEPGEDDAQAFRFVGGRDTWQALTGNAGLNGFTFIDEVSAFEALAEGEDLPDRVVGIPRVHSTLQASREDLPEGDTPSGMAFVEDVPNLATMTIGALNVLNQNPEGFFLMSEGGAVDWMGHANDMPRFIEEQIDFNEAVDAVIAWVEENSSWEETLLIVTSDHETGGIWGEGTWTNGEGGPVAEGLEDEDAVVAARFHPAEDRFEEFLAVQDRGPGTIPGHQWASGNHTNELVPLWAIGPGSELFAQFARTDLGAADLWGAPYGWDGSIVDNTAVFSVMNEAFMAEREGAVLN